MCLEDVYEPWFPPFVYVTYFSFSLSPHLPACLPSLIPIMYSPFFVFAPHFLSISFFSLYTLCSRPLMTIALRLLTITPQEVGRAQHFFFRHHSCMCRKTVHCATTIIGDHVFYCVFLTRGSIVSTKPVISQRPLPKGKSFALCFIFCIVSSQPTGPWAWPT